ncbi:MAG: pyridoxine 5'-phosphate synthase [Endomicrobium sp.]|jgi:pyridoxine 5-phosphate synthase|nr:pyridoxine 5'-phosphate synthase [Endomicrobium sp.]
MIKLGVNIDHIATIRQARKDDIPSVVDAALVCEKAGADSITVHLREDKRHIQDKDVYDLKKSIRTKLNLEMSAIDEIIKIALDVKPFSVCIVPEKRQELTTEGGLDVKKNKKSLASCVDKLKKAGIIVSMFIEADIDQLLACSQIGADAVEIHTGRYARFYKENGGNSLDFKKEFKKILEVSQEAAKNNLLLNAGHGLDYDNVKHMCKVPNLKEFNIGFSIIAKSVFTGLRTAVKDMKKLINKGNLCVG